MAARVDVLTAGSSSIVRIVARSWCAALALACSSAAAAREKVDVIVVANGDSITGEISALEFGRLSVKTDYMDTVGIEWMEVTSINTTQEFIIEDVHGGVHYGTLSTPKGGGPITIALGERQTSLELSEIARIAPGEQTLLGRVHGSVSVGFDYAHSSDITTLSAGFNTTYRGPETVWSLSGDVNSTKDPVQGTLDRDSLSFNYRWLRQDRKFWSGISLLERNESTGVEARWSLGGGLGRYLVQTGRAEFSALVGVVTTQEWATGEADRQSSLEGVIGADWRIFQFSTPKISLAATGAVFPSLTESDRYRTSLNVSLRREIISDLYFDLSFYSTYDSQPPDPEAEKSDYGVTTSLGYSFY